MCSDARNSDKACSSNTECMANIKIFLCFVWVPIRFCHYVRNTKLLIWDIHFKEGIGFRLTKLQGFLRCPRIHDNFESMPDYSLQIYFKCYQFCLSWKLTEFDRTFQFRGYLEWHHHLIPRKENIHGILLSLKASILGVWERILFNDIEEGMEVKKLSHCPLILLYDWITLLGEPSHFLIILLG